MERIEFQLNLNVILKIIFSQIIPPPILLSVDTLHLIKSDYFLKGTSNYITIWNYFDLQNWNKYTLIACLVKCIVISVALSFKETPFENDG